jgi:hypothetical protein
VNQAVAELLIKCIRDASFVAGSARLYQLKVELVSMQNQAPSKSSVAHKVDTELIPAIEKLGYHDVQSVIFEKLFRVLLA